MSKLGDLGKIQIIDSENDEEILKSEFLRYRAYGLPTDINEFGYSYYQVQIKNRNIVPYALYLRGRMVAGCYVSNTYDSLFIDQLFVMPELQESGLKLGRMLLRYVLNDKDRLSEMFQTQLDVSRLESLNEKSTAIYKKEGYEKKGHVMQKKL